jgi:hypothetical protein
LTRINGGDPVFRASSVISSHLSRFFNATFPFASALSGAGEIMVGEIIIVGGGAGDVHGGGGDVCLRGGGGGDVCLGV